MILALHQQFLPTGSQSQCGCSHPGPLEFTVTSPPAPSPQWLWRRGSVHFNLLAFWTPPQTTHTWYPHTHTNLHFKENSLHMFPIHLHFNSLWGGRRVQNALPPSAPPPAPVGRLESMCPKRHTSFKAVEQLKPDHLCLTTNQVLTV